MCDPYVICDYRLNYQWLEWEILHRTDTEIDAEINETQLHCSRETLIRRKVFVQDERDMLNTEMFLPVLNEEVDDLSDDNNINTNNDERDDNDDNNGDDNNVE